MSSIDEIQKRKEQAFLYIEQQKRKLEEKIQKQKKEAEALSKQKEEAKKALKNNKNKENVIISAPIKPVEKPLELKNPEELKENIENQEKPIEIPVKSEDIGKNEDLLTKNEKTNEIIEFSSKNSFSEAEYKTPAFQINSKESFENTKETVGILEKDIVKPIEKKSFIIKKFRLKEKVLAYEEKFKSITDKKKDFGKEEFDFLQETAHFNEKEENCKKNEEIIRNEENHKINEELIENEEKYEKSQENTSNIESFGKVKGKEFQENDVFYVKKPEISEKNEEEIEKLEDFNENTVKNKENHIIKEENIEKIDKFQEDFLENKKNALKVEQIKQSPLKNNKYEENTIKYTDFNEYNFKKEKENPQKLNDFAKNTINQDEMKENSKEEIDDDFWEKPIKTNQIRKTEEFNENPLEFEEDLLDSPMIKEQKAEVIQQMPIKQQEDIQNHVEEEEKNHENLNKNHGFLNDFPEFNKNLYNKEDQYIKEVEDYEDEFEDINHSYNNNFEHFSDDSNEENAPFEVEEEKSGDEIEKTSVFNEKHLISHENDENFDNEKILLKKEEKTSKITKNDDFHVNYEENHENDENQENEGNQEKVIKNQENPPKSSNFISFDIDVIDDEALKLKKLRILEKKKQQKMKEIQEKHLQAKALKETAKFGGEFLAKLEKSNEKPMRKSEKKTENQEKPLVVAKSRKSEKNIIEKPLKTTEKPFFRKNSSPEGPNFHIKKPSFLTNSPLNNKNNKELKEKDVKNPIETPKNIKKKPVTPKKFVKTNNQLLIKNAICNVSLAGEANKKERELVLSKLDEFKQDYYNFIIIFFYLEISKWILPPPITEQVCQWSSDCSCCPHPSLILWSMQYNCRDCELSGFKGFLGP